jgi:alpha-ketoglutarate-dependent taurine dioxygenase
MSTYPFKRRASNNLSSEQVTLSYFRPDSPLPLVVRPAKEDTDLVEWATANKDAIESYLLRNGAILFRKFRITGLEEFERLIGAVFGPLPDYSHRSTPRHVITGRVYSSTEHPAHQSIPLHNESSATRNWPLKLFFFAQQIAEKGGETPLADGRRIYEAISPDIRECFVRKGLMYVRNYGAGFDLPWQEVFQTGSKAVVEDYCRKARIEFEWIGEDQFRTRQRCNAVEQHPQTGEKVWFNQAHLFHVSRLPAEVRDWLLAAFGEHNLPRNVYFADGTRIEPAMLDEIMRVSEQQSIVFAWNEGDVLMVDNMLTAHGRKPYLGNRRVVVRIGEPHQTMAKSTHAGG